MRITSDTTKGFFKTLRVAGQNCINPWGIEAADSASAFRWSEKPLRLKQNFTPRKQSESESQGDIDVIASEGEWHITYDETMSENVITRTHSLEAVTDTYLLDFVSRYRFKKKWFDSAKINRMDITKPLPFAYYQFRTKQAELFGQLTARVNVIDVNNAGLFDQVMYVMEKKDEWVIHARLLPKKASRYILKLCTPWFNKAVPDILARPFIRIEWIRDYLLYRGERILYKKPWSALAPNVYKLAFLPRGTKITIQTRCEITERS